MSSYRNCCVCTRWRPISDFPPKSGYVAHTCRPCRNADKRLKYKNDAKHRATVKRAHREHQVIKRRERGVPVRPVGKHNKGKYGAGRVKPVDAEKQSEAKKQWLKNLSPEEYRAYRDRENKRKRKSRQRD